MLALAPATPVSKSKAASKKKLQRIRKQSEYRAETVTWQEVQHYQFAFENWLKENVSQEVGEAFMHLYFLNLVKDHGIGPNGHLLTRRARNAMKKFLPEFNPQDWEKKYDGKKNDGVSGPDLPQSKTE